MTPASCRLAFDLRYNTDRPDHPEIASLRANLSIGLTDNGLWYVESEDDGVRGTGTHLINAVCDWIVFKRGFHPSEEEEEGEAENDA